MASPSDEEVSGGSILRDLIFNQYQAIVLGGTALVSLIGLNPLPLLIWLGSELVLLPVLDSGPLRRLVAKRRLAQAREKAAAARERLIAGLTPPNARRYQAMEQTCAQIEANYQGLSGISQAYLSEQRGKLDSILQGCLHRLVALQRYERMPVSRSSEELRGEIAELERELEAGQLPARAEAAVRKNLELKQKLLASLGEVGSTVKTLLTELDSMESLLEVLHQNSISLRDPQAISEELDSIVRQSEDSDRVVREMEALLRSDGASWAVDAALDADAPVIDRPATTAAPRPPERERVKRR